jgi:pyrophosphatase PpaX
MALASPNQGIHPAIGAVVWDYDGTLVDTRFADEMAIEELLRMDPAMGAGAEVYWALEGTPLVERLEAAWPGRLEETFAIFERPVAPREYPGIKRVLDRLQGEGVPQAVVSSRRREGLLWGLEVTNLLPYFETVISVTDVLRAKPDPEGLLEAFRRLGVRPSAAVYIGDSDVDIEAGRRAGATAWRATWCGPHPATSGGPILLRRPADVIDRLTARERDIS